MLRAMSFILSKVGWIFLQPGNLLLVALILLTVFGRMGRRTRAGMGALAVALLVVALTPAATWALRPLDERFPPPTDEQVAAAPGIIVLGGPVRLSTSMARPGIALSGAAERYTEAMRLARSHPEKTVAFSGGTGSLVNQAVKEGPFARILLTEAGGIDPDRLVIEEDSRTTAETPALLADLLPEEARGAGWLLVTSAWHMPRSVGVFEAAGWRVVAYPVDYRTRPDGGWYPGVLGGLADLTMAVHEWAGLLAYRVMGRTTEVFPGP